MKRRETMLRTMKRRAMRREGLTFSQRVQQAVRTEQATSYVLITDDRDGKELNAQEINFGTRP